MSFINIVRPNMLNVKTPTTVMIYGPSGIGKTTQAYFIAKWLAIRKKKISRVIVCDPGQQEPFKKLQQLGIAQVLNLNLSPYVLADSRRLSEGYWPRGNKFDSDDACRTTPAEFSKIGAYIIDSATGLGSLMKGHMSKQSEGVGFKPSTNYTEDGIYFGGLQEGHYGMIQTEIHNLHVHGFANLPVDYIIWTALDGIGKDKLKAALSMDTASYTVYAPQIVGQAVNAEVPSWFRDVLNLGYHYAPKPDQPNTMIKYRAAWFEDHTDPQTGIKYLTKSRITPELIPKFREQFGKWGGNHFPLGLKRGVDVYLEAIEVLNGDMVLPEAEVKQGG